MIERFSWQVDTLLMLHEQLGGLITVIRLAFHDIGGFDLVNSTPQTFASFEPIPSDLRPEIDRGA
jgi:hypothetical protein